MNAVQIVRRPFLGLALGMVLVAAGSASSAIAQAPARTPPATTFRKPADAQLRRTLTPIQYQVTQRDGTEPPFHNDFFNDHRAGIFVDVVSGEALFSSTDKYDSHTGWPSFTKPLETANIVRKVDRFLGTERIEVRSKAANSHLGHVFDDGPAPAGLRYCINSAALRFIPAERLQAEGYGRYLTLFATTAHR